MDTVSMMRNEQECLIDLEHTLQGSLLLSLSGRVGTILALSVYPNVHLHTLISTRTRIHTCICPIVQTSSSNGIHSK